MYYNNTDCASCPFARHLEGNRYKCTAWGLNLPDTQTRGHWKANDRCIQELEKARDRAPLYQNHWLNAHSSSLKNPDMGFNHEAINDFWQWQNEADKHRDNATPFTKFIRKYGIKVILDQKTYKVFKGNVLICRAYPWGTGWQAIAEFSNKPATHEGNSLFSAIAPLVVLFDVYITELIDA